MNSLLRARDTNRFHNNKGSSFFKELLSFSCMADIASSKLPAGPVDIPAHFSSYSSIYSVFFKCFLEMKHRRLKRSFKSALRDRIDGDQIDVAVLSF